MNDRLSTNSPFTQPTLVVNYPRWQYNFRGIPYTGASHQPNDYQCMMADGTVLKAVSFEAIKRLIRINLFSMEVLVFPGGAVTINAVTTEQVTNPDIDSRLERADSYEDCQWFPLYPNVQKLYQAAKAKAVTKYLDTVSGEIFE